MPRVFLTALAGSITITPQQTVQAAHYWRLPLVRCSARKRYGSVCNRSSERESTVRCRRVTYCHRAGDDAVGARNGSGRGRRTRHLIYSQPHQQGLKYVVGSPGCSRVQSCQKLDNSFWCIFTTLLRSASSPSVFFRKQLGSVASGLHIMGTPLVAPSIYSVCSLLLFCLVYRCYIIISQDYICNGHLGQGPEGISLLVQPITRIPKL